MLTEPLLQSDLSQMQALLIVMALIFLLGWPLEWVPIGLIRILTFPQIALWLPTYIYGGG